MTQILGIKLSDHGPVCYFSSGQFVVQKGQAVLVETDQGLALGRVATIADPEQKPAPAPAVEAEALDGAAAAEPAEFEGPAPFVQGFSGADWDQVDAAALADEAPVQAQAAPAQAAPPRPDHEGHIGGDGENTVVMDYTQPQPKPKGLKGLSAIVRLARQDDLDTEAENRRLARRAHTFCRHCINDQRLDMKLVDVEVLHDRGKMIFYFTAPGRIDFRELIKSLVREFHTRIELRQIGVRHETQMLGAIGNCGQVCCCRRFLRKFAPVTIKMAKEQNLFLNPAKISGICGRLLCCLSYEQKGYEEFHKQCPKIGKRVQTPLGSLKVLRANFFKKSISVWMEEGGEREFTLDEWREMLGRPAPDRQAEGQAAPASNQQGGQQARSGDRPERSDRGDRPERSDRGGRRGGERGPRPERGDRPARPERADRPDRGDRPDRPEKSDRPDRPEKSERQRPPRPDQQNQSAPRGDQPEGAAQSAPGDAPGAPGADPGAEGAARRPRRKRRKPRGPKPEN